MTSYDVHGHLTARVRMGRGRLEVNASAGDTAQVAVSALDPDDSDAVRAAEEATTELTGDQLTVEVHGRNEHRAPPVLVVLTIPIGTGLKATAGDLDVAADVSLGDVALRLGNGSAELGDCAVVEVKAGNLALAVGDADEITVAAGNAEISAGDVRDARLRSGAGSMSLASSTGRVTAKGGQIELTIASTASGEVDFRAASGSATIGVAVGTDVHLDLVSAVGDVTCTLPVESDAPPSGASLSLRLHTGAGDLRVHRAGEEPPPVTRSSGSRGFPDIGRMVEDAMSNVQVQLDRAGLSGIRIDATGDRSRPRWAEKLEKVVRKHAGTTTTRFVGEAWDVEPGVTENRTWIDGQRLPVDDAVSTSDVQDLRAAGYEHDLVEQLPVDGPWTVAQLLTVCRAGLAHMVELVEQLPLDGPLSPAGLTALVEDGLDAIVRRAQESAPEGPLDPDDLLPRFGSESA